MIPRTTIPAAPAAPVARLRPCRATPDVDFVDFTVAGHALGAFALFYSSLQWAHHRRLRLEAERRAKAEESRKARQAKWMDEYRARVKNNLKGFDVVADDDE